MRRMMLSIIVAGAVLAAGYAAAARTMPPAWQVRERTTSRYSPAPLSPDDDLREAYGVRLNGRALDFARFSSKRPLKEVLASLPARTAGDPRKGSEEVIAHGDGFGGTIYWKSRAPLFPLEDAWASGDFPGADPGGVRPPNARRLLSTQSDRPDALSAALYEAGEGAARALATRLATGGWAAVDLGEGLSLWARGAETLLLDAPGPGRPGISLVYWRAPGDSP